jgi:hypothetical protein
MQVIKFSVKIILALLSIVLLLACKKDKVMPCPELPELSQWEQMDGDYKVYDTLGTFLYDMSIEHTRNTGANRDTLRFINFDHDLSFKTVQLQTPNPQQPNYVQIGYHDTLYDSDLNRWKLFNGGNVVNYSRFESDTFTMYFDKTNINYWIEDVVPYFACDCKQIAVKQ